MNLYNNKNFVLVICLVIVSLFVFISTSVAAFFSIKDGSEQVLNIGDLKITFCADSGCESGYDSIGDVIGLENGLPSKVYPYTTTSEALASTPYIFKVKNSGTVRNYLTAKLVEDTSFTPSGDYSDYEPLVTNYGDYLKVAVSECPGGVINNEDARIFSYTDLVLFNNEFLWDVILYPEQERTYCLWTWLDNTTPNDVQKTYFVANLEFKAEFRPKTCDFGDYLDDSTLGFRIINDNNCGSADNVNSTYVRNDPPGINFAAISSDINGKGLYYTSDLTKTEDVDGDGNGEKVYYYRGSVRNNYVSFGGYCWKIVRTNEDGSIRLRYSGVYDNDNKCNTIASIGSIPYNYTYGDNAYVGYMMGIDNQCTSGNCAGTTNTTSYQEAHANVYDSTVKKYIDEWYENNILTQGTAVTSMISNAIYCNDRLVASGNGYGNNTADYAIKSRIDNNKPIYKCNQQSDKFTLSVANGGISNYGNNSLKYPVALLTGDELYYGGLTTDYSNGNLSFLVYSYGSYWTMSPFHFYGNNARVSRYYDVALEYDSVYYSQNVFPAISLKPDVVVSGGSGYASDPYMIKNGDDGLVVHINFNNKDYVMYPGTSEAGNVMISLYDVNNKHLYNDTVSVNADTKYIKIDIDYTGSDVPAILNGVFTNSYFAPIREEIDIELN